MPPSSLEIQEERLAVDFEPSSPLLPTDRKFLFEPLDQLVQNKNLYIVLIELENL